jgi:hypothetical protein
MIDMIKNKLVWVIIGFGILLRLAQYLYNRSLWLDEAHTTMDILSPSFSDLFNPFYPNLNLPPLYGQTAPFGFFILEKLSVQIFGDSEYALRLFPLLFGIISLFLFYFVAKHYIKPKAVPIALALFAISDSLIYYSSEVNQYSSDIVITLLLFLMAIYIQSKKLTIQRIALFGVIGATVIWFSNPSVFILAGVGASLAIFSLVRKDWTRIGNLLVVYSLWILSFAVYYFIYLSNLANNKAVLNTWKGEGAFMPFPPTSPSDIWWFINTFFTIFANPTLTTFGSSSMLAIGGIASFAFLVGCISIFSKEREKFFILLSPAFFALLASGVYLYPFLQRTLLFLVPSLLLFVAEGTEEIRNRITNNNLSIIGIVFIGLLFSCPLLIASYHLIKPRTREEIKPVISYVKKHWQDGDVLYLHFGSEPAFKYYAKKYGFSEDDYIIGVYVGDKNNIWALSLDDLKDYTNDLDKLRGNKRVWILFSHALPLRNGINEVKFILYYLNSIGKRLDFFKATDSVVYLYDLSGKMEH